MDGDIDEIYLSELHERRSHDSQQSIFEYTGSSPETSLGTAVAVVTDPTGGILDVSDEFMPELGMPENLLNKLRKERSNLDIDDSVERHNTAVERIDLENLYKQYIRNDSDARESIEELAERVNNGEKITIVCFEKKPKWCHRHILKDEIEWKCNQLSE